MRWVIYRWRSGVMLARAKGNGQAVPRLKTTATAKRTMSRCEPSICDLRRVALGGTGRNACATYELKV